eukprot:1852753-Lingulodinium_polyedra.AAC.1
MRGHEASHGVRLSHGVKPSKPGGTKVEQQPLSPDVPRAKLGARRMPRPSSRACRQATHSNHASRATQHLC